MATVKKKSCFRDLEQQIETEEALRMLVANDAYNTEASYSANSDLYPNNLIPFFEKHMGYLLAHPALDPWQYVANLRLMTRIR